jgi:hypothetical protein
VHGIQDSIPQKSGSGCIGAAWRIEGRAGSDGQYDAGSADCQRPQGGAGSVVEKEDESLKSY